jgi:hypothetical protein
LVGIAQGVGKVHDAPQIIAVSETHKMTEFVHDLLYQAFDEMGTVQAKAGNDGGFYSRVGKTKDEIHTIDKDVILDQAEIEAGNRSVHCCNGFYDLQSMVLLSHGLVCVFRDIETVCTANLMVDFFFNGIFYG